MGAVVRRLARRLPRERGSRSGRWSERGTACAIFAVTVIAAVLLPVWAHGHLARRVAGDLVPALSHALGEPVHVGGVDASLIGTVRLSDVHLGRAASARALEASVALSPARLLAGRFDPGELRIEGPRLRVTVDRSGQVSMDGLPTRLRARLGGHRSGASRPGTARAAGEPATAAETAPAGDSAGSGPPAGPRSPAAPEADPAMAREPRRVVISDGSLTLDVGDCGRIRARGVELHPHRRGMRAVLADIDVDLRCGAWQVSGTLGRAAADIDVPAMEVERFLSVSGRLQVVPRISPASPSGPLGGDDGGSPDLPPATLVDVAIAHGADAPRGIEVRGRLARPGEDAPWRAQVARGDGHVRVRVEGQDLALSALAPLVPRSIDLTRGQGSGWLELTLGEDFGVAMDASVTGVVIADRRVARQPVALSGAVAASITSARDMVDVAHLVLTTGALRMEASGHMHHGGDGSWLPDRGELAMRVARVSCADALASLPAALREHLDGMVLSGEVAAAAALRFDRRSLASTALELDVDMDGCRVLHEAAQADPRRLLAPFEHRFSNGRRRRIGAGEPSYVRLSELPEHVARAFVSAEDGRFFDHGGFDLYQIERSLAVDLREGAFVRGGSTISQQLVKNLFLSHHRTLARKLQEAVLTWRLEAHLDKAQILERYLNIIELGPGIFGVEAAAQYWFGKPAAELGLREAAFLATLTPAPRTLSRRILDAGGIDGRMDERIDVILRAMRRDRALSHTAYQRARGEPLVLRADLLRASQG